MDKSVVRRKTITKMKQEAPTFTASQYRKLFNAPVYQKAEMVGLYENTGDEINMAPIIFQALSQGKKVVFPRTKPQKQMEYVLWTPDLSLHKTKFGIWEPVGGRVIDKQQINLIVVPGVAFTQDGKRIGYGAGFFDRYLRDFRGDTVSLIRECQLYSEEAWESDVFDVPIDTIIH